MNNAFLKSIHDLEQLQKTIVEVIHQLASNRVKLEANKDAIIEEQAIIERFVQARDSYSLGAASSSEDVVDLTAIDKSDSTYFVEC